MRIELKTLKAVARAASRETGRYAIAGIHVTRDAIEATDGRMMLRATIEPEAGEHVTERIVCASAVKTIAADPTVKFQQRCGVGFNLHCNGELAFDGAAGKVPLPAVPNVEFPDCRAVTPKPETLGFKVTLSASILHALASAADDMGDHGGVPPAVTFAFQQEKGASGPIVVTFTAPGVSGVAMPMSV